MTRIAAVPDGRSAIFASIRENLAASAPFDPGHHVHNARIEADSIPGLSADHGTVDMLDAFKMSLEMVGAKCAVVENENRAAEQLREIVTALSATKVVISDSALVRRLIETAGIDAIQDPSRAELFASDIGVTSAQWAIAETGTLVLESGAELHRLVSLVPPVHFCVLNARSIRQTMAEILAATDPETHSAITFITGASRTSDIELTLAIGVHGPGVLHVVVIKDQ